MRDPAAYLKRSELATPKSFDQDFNFISGIERTIERADRNVTSRGVQLRGDQQAGRRDGPVKGEVQLQRAIERGGVVIEKAPVGMSRNTTNKTSWNKSQQCISWTVEWVLDDGLRELGTCLEKDVLSEAFRKQYEPSIPRFKRRKTKHSKGVDKAGAPKTDSGEKLDGHVSPDPEPSPSSTVPLRHSSLPPDMEDNKLDAFKENRLEATDLENAGPDAVSEEVSKQEPMHLGAVAPATMIPEPTEVEVKNLESIDSEPTDPVVTNLPPTIPSKQSAQIHPLEDATDPPSTPSNPPALTLHFYLHLPHPATPSSKPTILPLLPSSTLATALRNRIVREYPTIYVLKHPADDLSSAKFTLQTDMDAELKEAMEGMLDAGKGGPDGDLDGHTKDEGEIREVDGGAKDVGMDIGAGGRPDQMAQSQLKDLRYIQESFI
ncbi:hypothetical protein MMC30_002703 [Trapelia coarctata]|nr:hypothetical protein [Trapelia coarctata]